MKVLTLSQIVDQYDGCPYCMEPQGDRYHCCGEYHFERLIETADDVYTEAEVVIVEHLT